MQFPESWLREFCDPPISTAELAERLTMAGLEVEDLRPAAPPFHGVVVAEVLEVAKHPNADKLRVCQVNAGGGETLEIVCGAPNVRAGIKVPLARVGAELPPAGEGEDAKPFRIEIGKIRGVESRGMLCSARELKLSEDHGGLLILADDAPVGADLRQHLKLDDTIFTLKLTPNLGHNLSVFGVAREVAALTGAPLKPLRIAPAPVGDVSVLRVAVEAPDLCGRFSGRIVRGIDTTAKTPAWMAERLARCGQRTVAPLVDISNYVMFELGRPSHIFDLDTIDGGLTVRWARPGETPGAAQRHHRRARRGGRRHRRRQPCRIARRHHGRRAHGGVRCHPQRVRRGGVLVARGGRRALAPLQVLDRCRAPLRARRRPGDDGRAHRAHHRADRRDLRRQRYPLRSDRRPRCQHADAGAGEAARRPCIQGDRHPGDAGRMRRR